MLKWHRYTCTTFVHIITSGKNYWRERKYTGQQWSTLKPGNQSVGKTKYSSFNWCLWKRLMNHTKCSSSSVQADYQPSGPLLQKHTGSFSPHTYHSNSHTLPHRPLGERQRDKLSSARSYHNAEAMGSCRNLLLAMVQNCENPLLITASHSSSWAWKIIDQVHTKSTTTTIWNILD